MCFCMSFFTNSHVGVLCPSITRSSWIDMTSQMKKKTIPLPDGAKTGEVSHALNTGSAIPTGSATVKRLQWILVNNEWMPIAVTWSVSIAYLVVVVLRVIERHCGNWSDVSAERLQSLDLFLHRQIILAKVPSHILTKIFPLAPVFFSW